MQKQKKISFLTGIIIIAVAIVVLFGTAFAYEYFARIQTVATTTEKDLLGYWKIGNAEPIAFCDYDSVSGFGEYRSYLHERPAEWGTWQIDKNGKLTIQYDIPGEKPIVINSVARTGNILTLNGATEFNGSYTLTATCDGKPVGY